MDVDFDPNEGDPHVLCGLTDDRFHMTFRIERTRLTGMGAAVAALAVDDETAIGLLDDGLRVWIVRDESRESIAIGDTDSKAISYRFLEGELAAFLEAAGSVA